MKIVEVPAVPPGAIRVIGATMTDVPDGGEARYLHQTKERTVLRTRDAVIASRNDGARSIVAVDKADLAAFDVEGSGIIAVQREGGVTLVRWEQASGLHELGAIAGQFFAVVLDHGACFALLGPTTVAVGDAITGAELWRREVAQQLSGIVELERDGNAVVIYATGDNPFDPGDPETWFARERIPRTGEIEKLSESLVGETPDWYQPAYRSHRSMRDAIEHHGPLVVSPDGARIATPTFHWSLADDVWLPSRPLEQWYGGTSMSSAGTATPLALAYDGTGELLRVSRIDRRLGVERADGIDYLDPPVARCMPVPGTRRVVAATATRVSFGDVVLIADQPVRGLACADDGSAIGVAVAATVVLFDSDGARIGELPLLAPTGLAVARGGRAIACIDRCELTIVRGDGGALGPDDADGTVPAAFSPDATRVAYATTASGFAIVDALTGAVRASHAGLVSRVVALAFAPDGATLFTLGADGRITLWPVA